MFLPAHFTASILFVGLAFAHADENQVFGKKDNSESGLIGILYDFKQTQKRQPTGVDPHGYARILDEFLEKNWNESVLNRYFRATLPLYTTQIFIPSMKADVAPKAFGMEKLVKPAAWVIFYKGQVSPPEDGIYRFIGYADDTLVVAVNGKIACVGSLTRLKGWKENEKERGPRVKAAAKSFLTYGDWIPMKKNEPVDIDVLIGEQPGGQFWAFLLYEKQGAEYPRDAAGQPMYPIFQLAPFNTPKGNASDEPPFFHASEVWKGYQ